MRDAIRREYRRFTARRTANSVRRSHSRKRHDSLAGHNSTQSFRTRTHFRTKLKSARPSDEASGSRVSGSPSPETVNKVLRSETPSPQSPYSSFYYARNGSNHNPLQLQTDNAAPAQANRYSVTIPLSDLQC